MNITKRGIAVVLLVFALILAGCKVGYIDTGDDDRRGGGSGTTVLEGTWDSGAGSVFIFTGNTFEFKYYGTTEGYGTFYIRGSRIYFDPVGSENVSGYFSVSGGTNLTIYGTGNPFVDTTFIKDTGGGETTPIEGVWIAIYGRTATFTGNTFTYVYEDLNISGTFTVNLNTNTITFDIGVGETLTCDIVVSGNYLTISGNWWHESIDGTYATRGAPIFIPVTGIEYTGPEEVTVGDVEVTLTATVSPYNATNKNVKWWSWSEGLSSVTEDGILKVKDTERILVGAYVENGRALDQSFAIDFWITAKELFDGPTVVIELDSPIVEGDRGQWDFFTENSWSDLVNANYLVLESRRSTINGEYNEWGFGGIQVFLNGDGTDWAWKQSDLVSDWLGIQHGFAETVYLVIQLDAIPDFDAFIGGEQGQVMIRYYSPGFAALGVQKAYLVNDFSPPPDAVEMNSGLGYASSKYHIVR